MRDTDSKYPSTYIQDQQDITSWLSDTETLEDSDQVDELISLFDSNKEL